VIPDGSLPTGAPSQDGAPVVFPRRAVVFDTNVLLSLFVFADSRFAPLRAKAETGEWLAYSSAACLDEFRRVLSYPIFKLDEVAQEQAYAAWQGLMTMVAVKVASGVDLPRCQDHDDQKFLELARDAGADWLVTADKALLKLARRDKLRGLFRILTPDAALTEL
jgi:putative PIN family toxin of toxin-antitoxin system